VHHHLGIESWWVRGGKIDLTWTWLRFCSGCRCIAPIYKYAHRLIIKQRKQNRFSATIAKYLNCAILINPDVATFWNIRRHLVERVQLDSTSEFQFSTLVLSKKPKSSEAFFYRRWLYSFQSELQRWKFARKVKISL
jgi:hypothetical protein